MNCVTGTRSGAGEKKLIYAYKCYNQGKENRLNPIPTSNKE